MQYILYSLRIFKASQRIMPDFEDPRRRGDMYLLEMINTCPCGFSRFIRVLWKTCVEIYVHVMHVMLAEICLINF